MAMNSDAFTLDEYKAHRNETPFDYAERIVLTKIVALPPALDPETREVQRKLSASLGPFVSSSQGMRQAVSHLNICRKHLLDLFWTPKGKWRDPELSADNILDTVAPTGAAFVSFVNAWQPLMDSLAEIIHAILDWQGFALTKSDVSMVKLAERAKTANWPQALQMLKFVLSEETAWYVDEIRRLRNDFIHVRAHATIVPDPETRTQCIVQLEGSTFANGLVLEAVIQAAIRNYQVVAVRSALGLSELVKHSRD